MARLAGGRESSVVEAGKRGTAVRRGRQGAVAGDGADGGRRWAALQHVGERRERRRRKRKKKRRKRKKGRRKKKKKRERAAAFGRTATHAERGEEGDGTVIGTGVGTADCRKMISGDWELGRERIFETG